MAKGIGIILVVMGHCGATSPQLTVLASFHMPLFFFLSGLFLFRKEERFNEFVKKKAKTLLFPCVAFGLILSTYSTLIDFIRQDDTIPYGLRYVGLFINMRQNPFPGSLWFFPCLFLVEMIMFFLHKATKKMGYVLLDSICLAVVGLLIHHFYGKGLPWSIDLALVCTIFTTVGFSLKNQIWNKRPIVSYVLVALVFAISVTANYKYLGDAVDLYSCRIGSYPLFYLSAFSGIYLTVGLSALWSNCRFLIYLGQNSMIIYSIHFLIVQPLRIPLSMIVTNGFTKNIILTTITVMILIPIINLINRKFKWMTGKF